MTESERLAAVEDLKTLKARYWRGVDTSDGELVRSILHEDCTLDYRGCCTDPATGNDFMPAMNIVLNGRGSWIADAFRSARIVSVHQGHHHEIEVLDSSTARAIWAFSDQFFFPPDGALTTLSGHGFYHDSYESVSGTWLLKTTRIERLKVSVVAK